MPLHALPDDLPDDLPPVPEGVGEVGTALWIGVCTDVDDAGAELSFREMSLLHEAALQADLIARMQADLDALPSLVTERGDVSPLVSKIDTGRRTLTTLLRAVVPPDRSEINRQNVSTRYQRPTPTSERRG